LSTLISNVSLLISTYDAILCLYYGKINNYDIFHSLTYLSQSIYKVLKEKFEDTKYVITSCKSKGRHDNSEQRTNRQ